MSYITLKEPTKEELLEIVTDFVYENYKTIGKMTIDANGMYCQKLLEPQDADFVESKCYLTTSCAKAFNLPDDCYELKTLRSFRDNYMSRFTNGKLDIEKYYQIAPKIVKKINNSSNPHAIYKNIYSDLIRPCIALIEENKLYKAYMHYKTYTLNLEKIYLN